MSRPIDMGIAELARAYRAGETTPEAVVRELLDRIDRMDPRIGAFLEVYRDEALEEARRLGERPPEDASALWGVPVAIKDNICVKGKRTTCASRILEDYRPPYDATVIRRLREAGAVILGKTNLDEFAMGSSTENSAFRITRNPWDLERAPGGSSGGSAAAVAARMAPAALGTDTGGSIRQPASFCGVVGMKPTYGRVSRYGLVAFASSLDQIGPMTRSVEDAALLLEGIAGPDERDATSLDAPVERWRDELDRGPEGPRDFLGEGMDRTVEANFEGLLEKLAAEGVEVVEASLPHARLAVACYYIVANAEASSNLARYDGVKYGHRAESASNLRELYTRTRGEGFGEEVKRRILLGTYVLSAGYYDAYYLQAQKVRSLIQRDFARAFGQCHVILMPTSPTPAFRLGERLQDPLAMYLSDVFTIPPNLAGLPALSVPSGLSPEGLPLGVQVVGPALGEGTVLRAARVVERLVGAIGAPGAPEGEA
jgi:aspartyl-tRNA(Asn)/glutamyl-tRNA(Gln) amidotransferase subunit A